MTRPDPAMPDARGVPAPGRPLRMGVMCSGTTFEAWQAECIRGLLALGFVTPALLIVDAGANAPPRRSFAARAAGALRSPRTGWNLFTRLFVHRQSEACRPVDLSGVLAGAARVRCIAPTRGKWARWFTKEEIDEIRRHGLDFVLRFAFNIIKGEILSVPRLGVWSFHHDDLDTYRGQPACFWPLFFNEPVQGVTLQRLTEGIDNGVVLARAWLRSIPHSYVRHMDAALMASAALLVKVCRDLRAGAGGSVSGPASATSAPLRTVPGNAATAAFAGKLLRRRVVNQWRCLFRHDQWTVGRIDRPIHELARGTTRAEARWIEPRRRGTFIADPFGVRTGDATAVLAEELDDRDNIGRIVAFEWRDGETPGPARRVIGGPVHLSYPFLFVEEGRVYCVPESAAARRVELWRAVRFPDEWERVATLVEDFPALDPTIFRHDGRWWLLAAREYGPTAIGLYAWHADRSEGPWVEHAANPLKMDIRSTRPAGTPFVHDGTLYRPAQDGSRDYGGAVVFCRVDRLTPTEFCETPVGRLEPDPRGRFPRGVHTVSAVGSVTLIDGKRHVFAPRQFLRHLGRGWAKLRGRADAVESGPVPPGRRIVA